MRLHCLPGDVRQAPARMFGLIVSDRRRHRPVRLDSGAVTAYAGRCISRRQKYTFCLIAAGLNCMHMPIGTILGVFTLIVLTRDSVRQLFRPGTMS